jgi:uncharacterized protein (UPF0332 family)
MAVTAEQLRDGAQKAKKNAGDSEMERRVAASRTYYAALHRCHLIAQAQGIFSDIPGTHAQVIEALTRSRDTKLKSIGWQLEECRKKRVKADYHLTDDFTANDGEAVAEQCERIWARIEGIEKAQQA